MGGIRWKDEGKIELDGPRGTSCGCTGVFVGGYLVINGILVQRKIA